MEAKTFPFRSTDGSGLFGIRSEWDLLSRFEAVAESRESEPAIYLKDPRTKGGESARYLSLTFSDLKSEIDAWSKRLRGLGIGTEDRVLVWLPTGLAMVAATHALLRIGAEVVLAAEGVSLDDTREKFCPEKAIVSGAVVNRARELFGADCEILEIQSPLLRLASGVKSSQGKRGARDFVHSGISVLGEDTGGKVRMARFGPEQLCRMLEGYEKHLCIGEADTELSSDCLTSVLASSLGVCTVFPEAGFGFESKDPEAVLVEAIEDVAVSRLRGDIAWWRRHLDSLEARSNRCLSVRRLFLETDENLDEALLGRLKSAFPNADVFTLLSVLEAPVAAVRKWEASDCKVSGLERGYESGDFLPGIEAKIVKIGSRSDSADSSVTAGKLGILHLSGNLCGRAAGYEMSVDTGYFATCDEKGTVRVCSRSDDIVRSSFGLFVPSSCEPIFARHENVTATKLVSLETKAGTRPGAVIEVKPGHLPKSGLAESKFRAELLQLGAKVEDTKMILDFFFVERMPNQPRAILSRRYSVMAKLKSLF
ncbi:AMP-binding protein [Pelagicoccus sp. SDUM812002]|nr:AMP-binding protein [Pelagicoccus sp. SDUM812002]